MNKISVGIITSIIGGAAGFIGGFFYGKYIGRNDAWDDANEAIDETEEYYKAILRTYEDEMNGTVQLVNPIEPEKVESEDELIPQPLSDDQKEEIRRKLKENYEQTTDYSKMYEPKSKAKADNVYDKAIYTKDPSAIVSTETIDRNSERQKGILVIDENELGDVDPNYSHDLLFYYNLDDVITDENGDLIIDYERLLGSTLNDSEWIDNNDELLFVLNHNLNTVYEVQKVFRSYREDSVV